MNWPLFHSWGLIHGSIFLLFPLYFLTVHVIGKKVHGRLRCRSTVTPPVAYLRANWIVLLAFVLGVSGFMIPFLPVGGVILGFQARGKSRKSSTGVDRGLANASIVLSSLGVAYQLYIAFTITIFYISSQLAIQAH